MKLKEIQEILNRISFRESCIDMGWKWQIKDITDTDDEFGPGPPAPEFLIRTSFQRPDTNSGEIGTGYGRWMHIPPHVDETRVIMTAWLCVKLVVEHELMESFQYDDARVFHPHKSIEQLVYPEMLKRDSISEKEESNENQPSFNS